MKKGSRSDPSPFFGILTDTRIALVGNPAGCPLFGG